MIYDHLPWTIVSWLNRTFWLHDRALWLQWLHCRLHHPGSGFNICRYCIEVGCMWCHIRFIKHIEALSPASGWKLLKDRGWACPGCYEAIHTALTWEPIQPTDDYES